MPPWSSGTATPTTTIQSQPPFTAQSSPLSTPLSSETILKQNSQLNRLPYYRRARELPFELALHAQTYYEESLFTGAFSFLNSVVSNSISASNTASPVIVPPPAHLAVAATLAIHPILTTRTTIREKWEQANAAFRLLKLVLSAVGPIESKLNDAFKFKKYDNRSSRTAGRTDYAQGQEGSSDRLHLRFAESDSIWSRAEDFWQTAGWALNCSCLPEMHAARWQHWQLWLEFMIDVLECDWELHYHYNSCEESLIWQYIELASGGYGRQRRIMRAIFADGSTRSQNEFREVFHNELKPPSPKATGLRKRDVNVDVDKEVFGDYLSPDSSDISDSESVAASTSRSNNRTRTRTPSTRRNGSRASSRSSQSENDLDSPSSPSHSTTTLGPPAALTLRMRLLHLLSHVSGHPTLTSASPTTFPDLGELYTLFVEWIKPLPLPLFQQIICPSTPADVLSPDAHTTLCEVILQRSLESAAPAIRSEKFLTKDKLVEMYLRFAASSASVAEQAKVSLLLEALLRRSLGMLKPEHKVEVLTAVNMGVDKRMRIAREWMSRKKRKKTTIEEEQNVEREAWKWLVESGTRMRAAVELVEE